MISIKQPLTLWISLFLILLLGTGIKVLLNAYSEFEEAEEWSEKQNFQKALVHYERALRWYFPGLGIRDQAAEQMWQIGQHYEEKEDASNALSAYRLLRSSFFSARSFYTPGQEWIARCNDRIATLMAAKPATASADRNKSFEQRKQEILQVLSRERSPVTTWSVVTEIGFFGWVACGFLFIIRAITQTGSFQKRPALIWGSGFVLCYGLWVLGMFNV